MYRVYKVDGHHNHDGPHKAFDSPHVYGVNQGSPVSLNLFRAKYECPQAGGSEFDSQGSILCLQGLGRYS